MSIGATKTIYAYGQVITDNIQALLIRDEEEPLSRNRFPHKTMATANGAQPSESNQAIERAVVDHTVVTFPEPIAVLVTEGYFDGSTVHVG